MPHQQYSRLATQTDPGRYDRAVTSYPFLSPDWVEAAKGLRAEYADQLPDPVVEARINVIVTDVPHLGSEKMLGHIDTVSGETTIEEGHLDDAELTVTVDYDTAKAAFVTRDQQKVMEAFFGGKILVEGDASKLLALQAEPPPDVAPVLYEMYEKLNALTD